MLDALLQPSWGPAGGCVTLTNMLRAALLCSAEVFSVA